MGSERKFKKSGQMLRNILEAAGLNPKVCADLLGIDATLFYAWLNGSRPLPAFIVPELSSVLGVPPERITNPGTFPKSHRPEEDAPAIWFKFRAGDKLTEADREMVVVIRKLGHYIDELEQLTGSSSVSWKVLFETIRNEIDKQSSPKEQGKRAAALFRGARNFGFPVRGLRGISGSGDILRGNLRSTGIRVIETPIQGSNLEGCSFYVGGPGSEKPCLFVNSYKQTWFRRNVVLMHELAHAIFDIETAAASLDFLDEIAARQFEEIRAQAFAQEALVPPEVLYHIARSNGLEWERLNSVGIAILVAYSQVEQRTVIRAATEAGFIAPELTDRYMALDIHADLKRLTERALDTQEFIAARQLEEAQIIPAERRTTTVPARALRLPLPYVTAVLELAKESIISLGKAAQMLMVDQDTLRERFPSITSEVAA